MGGGPVAWFCRRDDIPCTYRTLCAALMRERWQTGALWKDRVPPRRHETLHQVSWMGEPCWRGRGGAAWSSHRDKWETKCAWLLGQRNGTTWPRKRGIARVDKYEIGYKSDGASRIYSEGKYIRGQSSDYRRPTACPLLYWDCPPLLHQRGHYPQWQTLLCHCKYAHRTYYGSSFASRPTADIRRCPHYPISLRSPHILHDLARTQPRDFILRIP